MFKKTIILLCAVLILALVIGCSADSIASFGKSLGKLSDATLVPRNPYYVQKATENVEAFIEGSEEFFVLGDPRTDDYDRSWAFKDDESIKPYLDMIDETAKLLLEARDSSANDKALRNALNAEYKGKAAEVSPYLNLYAGLRRENTLGSILRHFAEDEEHKANLVMILMFMGIKADKDMVESLENGIKKLKTFTLPVPFQSCDYSIIIRTTMKTGKLASIMDAVKAISKPDPGEKPKIDMEVLKQFVRDIGTQTGERKYQTVGDKITVGIIYSILSAIYDVDTAFRDDPDYKDPETNKPDYTRFFEFVFANDAAKAYMDKILTYFDAMSYIYNSKLDIAGLVSGAV